MPAHRRRRRRRRRPAGRRLALTIGVVLIGLTAVACAAAVPTGRALYTGVNTDVQAAQADLQGGLTELEDGYKAQDAARVDAAFASFARSRDRLAALGRRLQPLDAARGDRMPGQVRSRVATLDAAIDMATHIDRAGMTGARALLTSGLVRGPAASAPVATDQLTGLLASIRDDLSAANRSAAAIDVSVLPGRQQAALRKALNELRTAVDGLGALWPSLGAVLDLLGLNGPRTYLIEQVNPAELRSGGGFIGTVSLVHADRGRVTLAKSLPVEAFDYCDAAGCVHPRPHPWQPGYVAPPAELAGPPLPVVSQLTAWSLEDSGFYPDFASNATTAESFARRLLNTPIDGVVAIDYYAVAPLLQLTGPIALPQYGLTLTPANFVDTVVKLDLDRDPRHKDVIAAAANQIVSSLSHLPPNDVPRLLRTVVDMVRGRHLQLHFDVASVQHEVSRLGAADELNPQGASDFFMETEDNYGGSKADYFITRKFQLDLSRSGSVLQHRLTIDLHDGAPADRPYIGPHYYAYVRLTMPANATRVTVSSARSAEYAPIQAPARRSQVPPAGTQVAGGWIFILVGQGLDGNYQVTFTWDTPWVAAADGTAAVSWEKQPGTVQDPVRVTWGAPSGSVSTTGALSQDQVITLGQSSVAMAPAPGP